MKFTGLTHTDHLKCAESILELVKRADEVVGMTLEGYGKSSSVFKKAAVLSKRIEAVQEELDKLYAEERSRVLVNIPWELRDAFPESVYLKKVKNGSF